MRDFSVLKKISSSDRESLIRLASSLPSGNEIRRAILTGLQKTSGKIDEKKVHEAAKKFVGKTGTTMSDNIEVYGFKGFVHKGAKVQIMDYTYRAKDDNDDERYGPMWTISVNRGDKEEVTSVRSRTLKRLGFRIPVVLLGTRGS